MEEFVRKFEEYYNIRGFVNYTEINNFVSNLSIETQEALENELENNNGILENLFENENIIIRGYTCNDCDKTTIIAYNKNDLNYSGQLNAINYRVTANSDLICEECYFENYFTCSDCGRVLDNEECICTHTGDYICEDCYNESYGTCEVCEEVYHDSDLNEDCICYNCQEHNTDRFGNYDYLNIDRLSHINDNNLYIPKHIVNAIRSYHDTPCDFKYEPIKSEEDTKKENLFAGVELEVGAGDYEDLNETSCVVASNLNCMIESDSSIDSYGMEIISQPQSFKKWYEREEKIAKVFDYIQNKGFKSHDTRHCGLHVHISRKGLGKNDTERKRTIENLYLIFENCKKEIIQFSRRTDLGYCRFLSGDNASQKLTSLKDIKERISTTERYRAINLCNRNTIELRIFRGTLNIDTFFATLEFVENLILFAKQENILKKSFFDIINFKKQKHLKKYIKDRGIKTNSIIKDTSILEEIKKRKEEKRALKKEYTQKELLQQIEDFKKDYFIKSYCYNSFNGTMIYSNLLNRSKVCLFKDKYANFENAISKLNNYIEEVASYRHCEYLTKRTAITYNINQQKLKVIYADIQNNFEELENNEIAKVIKEGFYNVRNN